MQPKETESTVLAGRERVGDDWFECLTDEASPSGTGPQPVAKLALKTTPDRSHPEDLDIAEHDVRCQVGQAPVEVRARVHAVASPRQPGREVIWPWLRASGHEAQALA